MSFIPAPVTSVQSTLNNTTTPLAAGTGVYTGTAELNGYPDVLIHVVTDQNCTYYAEFSVDNSNWDTSIAYVYKAGDIQVPHVLVKGKRYFRLRIVNGATVQGFLRAYCYFGLFNKLTSSINTTLAQTFDAISVRPTNFNLEVSDNKRQGIQSVNKFGYAIAQSGVPKTLWAGALFTPLTTASTLTIVSASTADDDGSTGVNTVEIFGIDENREEAIETVTMNGTTEVTVSGLWFGVNRIKVVTAGSAGTNVGLLTCRVTGAGAIQAYVPASRGITQQLIYHQPSTHDGFVNHFSYTLAKESGGAHPRVTLDFILYTGGVRQSQSFLLMDTEVTSNYDMKLECPIRIPAGSTWWVNVDTTQNNTFCQGSFEQFNVKT